MSISIIFHSAAYNFLREGEVVHTYQPAALLLKQSKAERCHREKDFKCTLLDPFSGFLWKSSASCTTYLRV